MSKMFRQSRESNTWGSIRAWWQGGDPWYVDLKIEQVALYQHYFNEILNSTNLDEHMRWIDGDQVDQGRLSEETLIVSRICKKARSEFVDASYLEMMLLQYIQADSLLREIDRLDWVQRVLDREKIDYFPAAGNLKGQLGLMGLQTEPLESLRQRAEQGDAPAQASLGFIYSTGEGVPQDDVEAARWYRLAADQGKAVAQYSLGLMYRTGEGVPQDDVEAARWYRLAADQGFAAAQANLGFMYETGQGVPLDTAEAVRWFRLGAEQGDAAAQANLEAYLPPASVADKVKSIIVEQLDVDEEEVTADASFVDDLGVDSVATFGLVVAFEAKFSIEIPDEDVEKITRVKEAINYVESHAKGKKG